MNYSLVFIAAHFVLLTQTSATQIAQDECRDKFHMDAESRSYYLNEGCSIKCSIHGKWRNAYQADGHTCPLNAMGRCHKGNCRFDGKPKLGHIDVWFDGGEFRQPASYYVVACIRNSSEPIVHPIWISNCVTHCESKAIYSRTPMWKQVCVNSGEDYLFANYSRVAFDVWNSTIPAEKQFVGGGDLLISDLSQYARASIPVELSLNDKIFVNVTFRVPSVAPCLQLSYLLVFIIILTNITI